MGFFADQRLKNGARAVRSEDRAALPKNRLNLNIKPSVTAGSQGQDVPLHSDSSYTETPKQQKRSKQFPR